jgi:AcrR family transcriptional regulator
VTKAKVLQNLANFSTMRELAESAGIDRNTIYNWLNEDDEFKQMWNQAINTIVNQAIDILKANAEAVDKRLLELILTAEPRDSVSAVKLYHDIISKREDLKGQVELKLDFS